MTRRRFWNLLTGLSPHAVFRRVAGDELRIVDDPDRIRSVLEG